MEIEEAGIHFSRTFAVHTRVLGEEDLLALARSRALDAAVFEEYPPVFVSGEISSNRWDSYDTRMMPSSLKNYAEDAARGVAVCRHHDGRYVVGHSLTGRFTGGQGNGVAKVESEFYLLPDPEALPLVAKVRAGAIRDISIGFVPGMIRCTLCGRDMEQWFGPDGCTHILGMTYTPQDESGSKRGEPVKARGEIEDAHLAEYSVVYDGSTPGAMIHKARALAAEGLLSDRERELVQVRYRMHLPERTRIVPGADVGKDRSMSDQTPESAQVDLRAFRSVLSEFKIEEGADPLATVRAMAQEVSRLRPFETEATELRPLAADGRTYRADLVTAALAEGVRALGSAFDADTYRPMLEGAPLPVVKRMTADWKATADAKFPGGRITTDGPEKREETQRPPAPLGAYG